MTPHQTDLIKEIVRDEFITINLIRIGIAFITISVIRILVPFYKYRMRMSNFYQTREMALQLSGVQNLDRVKTFSDVLATDKYNFESDDLGKDALALVQALSGGK